ncbi:heterokaryon incompatibility protein-domain-containing protein [Phaeosphaeriaceae sp. PMI808]|nr:heterokaryon incompatibility protein-domain-containing protein [Phaeosphaeriaceae sp. PMI808]
MRLLELADDGTVSLIERPVNNIPHYAILSHTWGQGEVTFEDIQGRTGQDKAGYDKIHFCAKQATKDGLRYFWVDTYCIDKTSSAELTEALNSMFNWYKSATRYYVYLSNFTRGWTLQELLTPLSIEFFSCEGERLGDKRSLELQIREITGIATPALQGKAPSEFSVDERMKWASNRNTTRIEDKAYYLLGIFGIFMSPIYSEGANAFTRLQREIDSAEGSKGR